MKCLKTLLLLLGVISVGFSQNRLYREVQKERGQGVPATTSTDLFRVDAQGKRSSELSKMVYQATSLKIEPSALEKIVDAPGNKLNVRIPFESGDFQLELIEQQIYADGFEVFTSESNGHPVPYSKGKFYRGVIKDDPNSLAAISIVDGEVMGILNTLQNGNMVLGRYDSKDPNKYVLYEESQLKDPQTFNCDTKEPEWDNAYLEEMRKLALNTPLETRAGNCVKIYFEFDQQFTSKHGGASGATNYFSGIFNGMKTLYANESIDVQISEIFAWTTPDPYPSGNTSSSLNAFVTQRSNNFNGDLAHLISLLPSGGGGGIAYVDALCAVYGNTDYRFAYSEVSNTTSPVPSFPTYSWSVNVVTHETGHMLGSPHTHSCSWPGGPIDNCAPVEDGSCAAGPTPPTGGGTIMSYCHLNGKPGISFTNGFGPLPGNLIRNRVAAASCLSACGTTSGPTCFDGIKNGDETGVDCGGSSCSPCQTGASYCSVSGNTKYEYIKNVTFAGINRTSGADSYVFVGSPAASVQTNTSYQLKLTPGFVGNAYTEAFKVWIDWNQDGDFNDSGETVYSGKSSSTVTGSVTVPNSALEGTTRMRVSVRYSNYLASSCTNVDYGEVEDYNVSVTAGSSTASCTDGIKNGDETGIDCGGSCAPCATCNDGIKNGNETGIDCGGSCAPCATCNDGIKNGNETGIDCGGSCAPCATCNDGIQNGDETGIDCGGSCGPCQPTTPTCNDGIQNGDETGIDCGGSSCAPCQVNYCSAKGNNTNYEYIKQVVFAGINNTSGKSTYSDYTSQQASVSAGQTYGISLTPGFISSAYNEAFRVWIDFNHDGDWNDSGETVFSGVKNSTLSGSITIPANAITGTTRMRISMQYSSYPSSACTNLSYGEVEDYTVKISGGASGPTETCNDGIKNNGETGIDCGGPNCAPCATCNDGIKNNGETGIDCGGPNCAPCATCNDGIKNGDETGIDCGGSCVPCQTAPPTCTDGIQNGDETGVDCGGSSCAPCVINYCSSKGKTTYEYINSVMLGSINNTSGQNGGYGDYTGMVTSASKGQSVQFVLTPGYVSSTYNEGWVIWVDWNGDGDFKDSGENVFSRTPTSSVVSGSFTVPTTVSNGSYRVRIQMKYNAVETNSCSSGSWGETEDYTLTVTSGNVSNNLTDGPDALDVQLFPNPARNTLNLRFDQPIFGTIVAKVYDVLGQVVIQKNITQGESLDLGQLQAGYYLLELEHEQQKLLKKFMKE
ncbi:MAG: T9SS type A sorting domain-containing protein [Saprospiraceae bacterium]|nr:T9SS type A sorting domain-containing protein [Saprospiraceae bacterium]